MKVAIVHEHLAQDGGAEKVVRYMQEMFPGSPIFTLVHDKKNANSFFADKDIRTSFLQRWPGGVKRYKWFLPFMPTAVESYDLLFSYPRPLSLDRYQKLRGGTAPWAFH